MNAAVEILRDSKSRRRLDAQLNGKRKRARAPGEFSSSCSGRAKRERRSECPSERQFQDQSQDQSERPWTNYWGSTFFPQESYMRSHGAGADLGEEAIKAQEELLKEQMRDRMKRNIIRLMGGSCGPDFDTFLDWVINNSIDEMEIAQSSSHSLG
ncbi:uncharacterized protein N7515_010234 [Penicillium bovifimosum]|uniref:Uncharacterized protein n=1 Tax=Penicillium bovifimosum TaxID=126998 RepID=A0A9W9KTY2_9EURO|nr:uncharacterized protein N7515_010234 [Penicillium bovifimosum]KAJ5120846.1 hypothetical protein N7515_010234 [Penicillium bovifimosum]